MTSRSAAAEVTAHQAGLVAGSTAKHHPLLGEVISVTRLLGAVARGAGQHAEAATLAARTARSSHLKGYARSHKALWGHTGSHKVRGVTVME